MSVSDHNRIHAADVLHGVYYLSTQLIPGLNNLDLSGEARSFGIVSFIHLLACLLACLFALLACLLACLFARLFAC